MKECSYCSDRVTRGWTMALRVRAAQTETLAGRTPPRTSLARWRPTQLASESLTRIPENSVALASSTPQGALPPPPQRCVRDVRRCGGLRRPPHGTAAARGGRGRAAWNVREAEPTVAGRAARLRLLRCEARIPNTRRGGGGTFSFLVQTQSCGHVNLAAVAPHTPGFLAFSFLGSPSICHMYRAQTGGTRETDGKETGSMGGERLRPRDEHWRGYSRGAHFSFPRTLPQGSRAAPRRARCSSSPGHSSCCW